MRRASLSVSDAAEAYQEASALGRWHGTVLAMIRAFPGRFWHHYRHRAAFSSAVQDLEGPHALSGWVDAIVAIAATLLVLDLRAPEHPRGELGRALATEWQHYAAYALGYIVVLLGWTNTRRLLRYLIGVDYYLALLILLTNGAWTLMPFAVGTLAGAGEDLNDLGAAVRLMSGIMTGSMIFWAFAVTYANRHDLWQPRLAQPTRDLWIPGSQLVWTVPAGAFAVSYLPIRVPRPRAGVRRHSRTPDPRPPTDRTQRPSR